jgi:hypothetical protein
MGDVWALFGATVVSCCLALGAWHFADRFARWLEEKVRARSK